MAAAVVKKEPEERDPAADEHARLLDDRWQRLIKLGFDPDQADRICHINDVVHTAERLIQHGASTAFVVDELT
jgi:hypothetical protein